VLRHTCTCQGAAAAPSSSQNTPRTRTTRWLLPCEPQQPSTHHTQSAHTHTHTALQARKDAHTRRERTAHGSQPRPAVQRHKVGRHTSNCTAAHTSSRSVQRGDTPAFTPHRTHTHTHMSRHVSPAAGCSPGQGKLHMANRPPGWLRPTSHTRCAAGRPSHGHTTLTSPSAQPCISPSCRQCSEDAVGCEPQRSSACRTG
jgi:hypothetical protein